MTEIDDEAFKAIKDSIPPEYDDPNEDQQRAIDELDKQTGFDPNPIPLVEAATTEIMDKYSFVTIQETDEIWYYKEGVYVPGGEIIIAKEAENAYHFEINSSKVTEIKGHIMRLTYHAKEEFDADIDMINLKNGLYDWKNDILKEHSPRYLSINQKSIVYDKKATPKLFGKFLSQVIYPRHIRTCIDAMAYTFYRDYGQEVLFILFGIGRNGKTVFTSLLTHLLGSKNVSNVPLPAMLSDRFALSDLENKDANIDNELTHSTIKQTAALKRLTGGSRQSVRIERKNQKAYDSILHAKLFFNANKIPMSEDMSDAYNRRVTIISFPNTFDGAAEDKQLISKLTTEQEISGIFNVLMIALRRILKNKELYVHEKTIEEKIIKYQMSVDPIQSFLDKAVSIESTESDTEEKEVFYRAYNRFCIKHTLPIEKIETFGRLLKSKNLSDGRQSSGERKRYWKGVRLVPEYLLEMEQATID
jgi:P4 family phage/plasmid primase-like protien